MKTELQHCIRLFEHNEPFVLVTVLSSSGSVPRRAGARMIILQNGKTFGTVGGGSLEAKVTLLAEETFISKISEVKEFDLSVDAENGTMLCGGSVEMLIDYMSPENHEAGKAWNRALQAIQSNLSANLITGIPDKSYGEPGRVSCYFLSEEAAGSTETEDRFEKKDLENIRGTQPQVMTLDEKRFLIEPLTGVPKVYIFGSGHIAQQLAMLTIISGFKTVVLDDRRDYLTRRCFPLADELIFLETYTDPFKNVNIDSDSHLILLTRDHISDRQILISALETDAAYIGMIGSKNKCRAVRASLEQEGIDPDKFCRLHAPIGISIGAETPEEVAISIAAELIQQRSGVLDTTEKTN